MQVSQLLNLLIDLRRIKFPTFWVFHVMITVFHAFGFLFELKAWKGQGYTDFKLKLNKSELDYLEYLIPYYIKLITCHW